MSQTLKRAVHFIAESEKGLDDLSLEQIEKLPSIRLAAFIFGVEAAVVAVAVLQADIRIFEEKLSRVMGER